MPVGPAGPCEVPIDPTLWASTPYQQSTALVDFAGMLELWFRALADHVFLDFGSTFRVFPLGEPGQAEWLQAIQAQFTEAALAIGIPPPVDLASYDLRAEDDHLSFFFVLSQEARALRAASGLP